MKKQELYLMGHLRSTYEPFDLFGALTQNKIAQQLSETHLFITDKFELYAPEHKQFREYLSSWPLVSMTLCFKLKYTDSFFKVILAISKIAHMAVYMIHHIKPLQHHSNVRIPPGRRHRYLSRTFRISQRDKGSVVPTQGLMDYSQTLWSLKDS